MGKFGETDQVVERFEPDFSLPDIGVAVFRRAPFIFTVVDMEDRDLVKAQDPVELRKNPVRVSAMS